MLIKRLEAAVSRIEDLAAFHEGLIASASAAPTNPHVSVMQKERSTRRDIAHSIAAYDELVSDRLGVWLQATRELQVAVLIEQAALVEAAFAHQRALLIQTASYSQPNQATLEDLIKPIRETIVKAIKTKESKTTDWEWFNHTSMVAEGIQALGWLAVSPKPGPFVKALAESAEFYGHRVIREYKEIDPKYVSWTQGYQAVYTGLHQYIRQYHTTGVTWNGVGYL